MAIFGWSVLFLVFVDELLAISAAATWGEYQGGTPLAIAAALAVVVVWYLFASPKARYGGRWVRPVVKVLVFTLASVGLWVSGHETLAIAYFAFSVLINALAQLPSIKVLVTD
ncbi:DUF2568 domain-containing protein [Nocardioides marmoriginsengisoli]|uniref:DUF2568 domain-containing protein n=1 Tax=Nocardioides marmoriginsengisoli TaxID=661483 RepID=A0A3N0CIB8_9ACTN|nr:DUF2568 domain-containing protein [Nocardioides marmoriginsengisoli]RNL63192.1 DUF2568 domain-containing protein [Nocardioides marmoriginsengisoli]